MTIESKTVEEYIEKVPDKWKEIIKEVHHKLVLNINKEFKETLRWGMINFEVPLEISGPTYNKQPLSFVALAAQKNYCSLYVSAIYSSSEKRKQVEIAYKERGLKANMGKSCIRFKKIEDIPLDVILTILAEYSVQDYLNLVDEVKKSNNPCN